MKQKLARLDWNAIVVRAAGIVRSYNTGVTLRQLFYRLVADGTLENLPGRYSKLSSATAWSRRGEAHPVPGGFPDLIDPGRSIVRPASWNGPDEALDQLRRQYRRDRTEGQPWSIYLGVEKAGIVEQLRQWIGDDYGVPILALGGSASETFAVDVRRDILPQGRPAVLLYAGDHDPAGECIDADFVKRVGAFDEVVRVALNADQVVEFDLPHNADPAVMAKLERSNGAAAFRERHGYLAQYELDALAPNDLRDAYVSAFDGYLDRDAYDDSLDREADDLEALS